MQPVVGFRRFFSLLQNSGVDQFLDLILERLDVGFGDSAVGTSRCRYCICSKFDVRRRSTDTADVAVEDFRKTLRNLLKVLSLRKVDLEFLMS